MSGVDDLAPAVREAAVHGFKFAADKKGLALWGVDSDWIAAVVASHTLTAASNSGAVVERSKHDAELARLKARENQFSKYWSGAKVEADRQLQRVQKALSALEDRALAKRLADEIGVCLVEEPDGLFEVAS